MLFVSSDKEVPDDVQEEKDLTYQFKVFEKSS